MEQAVNTQQQAEDLQELEWHKKDFYMPPCCIDRRLPALLRQQGTTFFASQGDWGLAKLWHAASLMVPSCDPVFTLLVMEQLDEASLAVIKQNLARNWTQTIAIVTAQEQTALVSKHLADYIERVQYAGGREEAANEQGLWLRTNQTSTGSEKKSTLIIRGPIHHGDGFGHVCQYAAQYFSTDMQQDADGNMIPDNEPSMTRVQFAVMPYIPILHRASIKGSDPLFKAYL